MNYTAFFAILGGIGSLLGGIANFVQLFIKTKEVSAAEEPKQFNTTYLAHIVVGIFALLISGILLIYVTPIYYCTHIYVTPDGKYKAIKVANGKDVHYQIIRNQDNSIVFKTNAQYDTPNDVKAATFSSDSKKFAAAYHYSHDGNYTWIGVWDVLSGKLIKTIRRDGWKTSICFAVKE